MTKLEPLKENEGKGFNYTVSDEQIAEYKKLNIKEKFEWLQSINKFIEAFQTEEEWKRMQKFKNGEW